MSFIFLALIFNERRDQKENHFLINCLIIAYALKIQLIKYYLTLLFNFLKLFVHLQSCPLFVSYANYKQNLVLVLNQISFCFIFQ